MRWFAWYLQSLLCKHVWDYSETEFKDMSGVLRNYAVSATCSACGWHRRYLKFPRSI